MKAKRNQNLTTKNIILIGIITSIICILAQITIPMPYGVPLTMQTFGIIFGSIILGGKDAFISLTIYLLLGFIGLPVFAGFTSGIVKLLGPTGGFLISFPIMALIIGFGSRFLKRPLIFSLFLVLGICTNFAFGIIWFSFITKAKLGAAFMAVCLPFLPTAAIKGAAAYVLAYEVKKRVKLN